MARQQYIEARLIIPWNSDGTGDEAADLIKHVERVGFCTELAAANLNLEPYGWIAGFTINDGAPPHE